MLPTPSPSQDRLPPIQRLPSEIVSEILLFNRFSHSAYDERLETLYSCMRVCRGWNSIAESTPRLWGEVCLEINFESKGIANPEVRLKKSGNCPIQVSLNEPNKRLGLPYSRTTADSVAFGRSWSTIVQHLHRAETITMYVSYYSSPTHQSAASLQGPLPLLSNLSMVKASRSISSLTRESIGPLKRLSMKESSLDSSIVEILPLGELELLDITLEDGPLGLLVAEFLSRSPRLRRVILYDVEPELAPVSTTLLHVTSPSLEFASVMASHFTFMSSWSAPLLETLEIRGPAPHCGLYTVSFPSLSRLVLNLYSPHQDDIFNILSGMPSLLRISTWINWAPSPALMSVLGSLLLLTRRRYHDFRRNDGDEVDESLLCPRLRRIDVEFSYTPDRVFRECMDCVRNFLGVRGGVVISLGLGRGESPGNKDLAQEMAEQYKDRVILESTRSVYLQTNASRHSQSRFEEI